MRDLSGMRFGVIPSPDVALHEARQWWQEIERLGFDMVGIPDTPVLMRDGYVSLAAAAIDTQRIQLCLSVANVLTRDVTVTAGSILALRDLAPGRINIGFGAGDSSTYGVGLGGARLADVRGYIEAVRALLNGEATTFNNRTLKAAWSNFEPGSPPLLMSAHGERSLQVAGSVADGVICGFGSSQETVARSKEIVRNSAADAGRDPNAVSLWHVAVVAPGDTPEEGFLHSTGAGAVILARNGFAGKMVPEDMQAGLIELRDLFSLEKHSRRDDQMLEVAKRTGCFDYLMDRFGALIGPADQHAAVQKLHANGVDNVMFVTLGTDKIATVRSLAHNVIAKRPVG